MIPQTVAVVVLCFLVIYGNTAEKGEACVDEFGQNGICTNIQSCQFNLMNATVGERIFISGKVCGHDTVPLVCCKTNSSSPQTRAAEATDLTLLATTENAEEFIFTSTPLKNPNNPTNEINTADSEDSPQILSLDETFTNATQNVFLNLAKASSLTDRKRINKLLPDRFTCGLQALQNKLQNPSISSPHEFPWTVLLRYRYGYGHPQDAVVGFKCLGTLISNRYVLTSAQCVVYGNDLYYLDSIRLGDWIISTKQDCAYDYAGQICSDNSIDIPVQKLIPHDGYDPNSGLNNIALVRLEKEVQFTDFIRPICLPVEDLSKPTVGSYLVSAGWGVAKYGHQMDIKSKMNLPVLPDDKCINQYSNVRQLPENQACVGPTSSNSLCLTDTGGALMAVSEDERPQWYLEGVIPDGFACNSQHSPDVYIRVCNYVNWILDSISKDSD